MLIKSVRSIQQKVGKEFPSTLLKLFQEDNYMDRRAGSGRQQTITIEEYQNLIYIWYSPLKGSLK